MKRRLKLVAGVFLGLGVLAAAGGWLWLRSMASEARKQRSDSFAASFRKHGAEFVEDHRQLSAHPLAWIWSPGNGEGRDAGQLLNARLPWPGPDEQLARWKAAHPPASLLSAPKELVDAVSQDRWWRTPEGVPLPAGDLTFLDSLTGYERWNLATEGTPLATFQGNLAAAPFPSVLPLITLQRARQAQGLVAGDTSSAIRTGRALARLCFDSSTLQGAMAGVALLSMEAPAAAEAVRRGQSLGDLEPLSVELSSRLGRAASTGPMLFYYLDAPADAVALLPQVRAARCAAIGEQAATLLPIRPLLGTSKPEAFARAGNALGEPGCSLGWLRARWAQPVPERPDAAELCPAPANSTDCAFATIVWHLGLTELVGDVLSGTNVEPFRKYDEPLEK